MTDYDELDPKQLRIRVEAAAQVANSLYVACGNESVGTRNTDEFDNLRSTLVFNTHMPLFRSRAVELKPDIDLLTAERDFWDVNTALHRRMIEDMDAEIQRSILAGGGGVGAAESYVWYQRYEQFLAPVEFLMEGMVVPEPKFRVKRVKPAMPEFDKRIYTWGRGSGTTSRGFIIGASGRTIANYRKLCDEAMRDFPHLTDQEMDCSRITGGSPMTGCIVVSFPLESGTTNAAYDGLSEIQFNY